MLPVIALIAASVIWGAAPPIFKYAYENIPPFTLGFIRFALSVAILLPFLRSAHSIRITKRQWVILIAASLFVALHLTLFFLGLERTESINTSIIASAGPIVLYFASVKFLHEKKNLKILTGMCIALTGSLIVVVSPLLLSSRGLRVGQFEGNTLILLSTISETISIMLLKKSLKHMSPLFVTIVMFAISALIFYPLALGELRTWSVSQLDYRGVIGIIFGTLFSSTLAYYLHDYGISKIKAEEVGVFSYISTVVTVLVAVPLLAEYPTPYFYAGAVLVFAGVIIAERKFHTHVMYHLKH